MSILTKENEDRFVLFPPKPEFEHIYNAYKAAKETEWNVEEIKLDKDLNDWEKLKPEEREFISNILAFFAGSDGIVLENLLERFSSEVQIPEARAFYAYQAANETVHAETYGLLIHTYIKDKEEKEKLFNGIKKIDCIKQKADWAIKWIKDKESSFLTRLIAFAVVEGVFFSGSFCAIYWLKNRGLMPGLTFSNELISRDEGQHTDFAVLLYKMAEDHERISEKDVHEMFRDAVKIEKNFICDSIKCDMIGMNSEMMSTYIEFCADRLLKQLGYSVLFDSKNPFDFMESISLRSKTNFFEKRVAEYKKSSDKKEFKIIDKYKIPGVL